MYVVLGLALLGLTLYISTLTYALRAYSRSRLLERLSDEKQRGWIDWLQEHETELQVGTAVARIVLNLSILFWAIA